MGAAATARMEKREDAAPEPEPTLPVNWKTTAVVAVLLPIALWILYTIAR